MGRGQRGVILYGYDVQAFAEALRALDSHYVLTDHVVAQPGQVPVLRCTRAAEADAVREATPGIAWLVVELYRPGADVVHARDPVLCLNASKVDPKAAARAIDQPDLVVWYEIVNPIRTVTVDGGPPANDYSNIGFVVPEGHRMVAHAVKAAKPAPPCLPGDAELVLRSDDLWALAWSRPTEMCQDCVRRHGRRAGVPATHSQDPIEKLGRAEHRPSLSHPNMGRFSVTWMMVTLTESRQTLLHGH